MVLANNIDIEQVNTPKTWIQPSINMLDLSFYTQKIIDNIYSVIDEKVEARNYSRQDWFWTNEWQTAEQKVDEYIQKGNIEEYDTMEDFLKTLRE